MKNSIIINHLSAAIITTILCLLIYASVQQGYRTAANDPQIQLASEIKNHLEQSRSIENIFPCDSIDLLKTLSIFAVLYDNQCHVIESSASLNNENPILPKGVFDVVKINGEDIVTWQPKKNVRMAMVVMKVNSAQVNYVAVGRSLSETEVRESDLLFMVFIGWIICMSFISINATICFFTKNKISNG
ncbi:MAG TPA: hypothetical protein VIH86_01555 [Puia sp.]|jgi:hypothetical protein